MTQPDGKPARAPTRPQRPRWQRIAAMDTDLLDVEGAATLLGVSASTISPLAQQGKIPATRIGREWRFARQNLVQWVINGSEADQLAAALATGRGGRPRREDVGRATGRGGGYGGDSSGRRRACMG